MAAAKKIDKEGILDAAYRLVRKEGLGALSARKLAQEAACSTQPIYENFGDMGAVVEITKERMLETVHALKTGLRRNRDADYSRCGTEFCRFAMEEKMLFKHYVAESGADMTLVKEMSAVKALVDKYGFDSEKADLVDGEMIGYILGKAFLVNSGYEEFDEEKTTLAIQNYQEYIIGTFVK